MQDHYVLVAPFFNAATRIGPFPTREVADGWAEENGGIAMTVTRRRAA
jgi:hypothetical protein